MPEGWLHFQLIERPYYDRRGNVLASIAGRRNRTGVDEFTGGGWVLPDVGKVKVIEWHQKDGRLLVRVDGDQKDIDILAAQRSVVFAASPIEQKTVLDGFRPCMVIYVDAEKMKRDVFVVAETAESGVTK